MSRAPSYGLWVWGTLGRGQGGSLNLKEGKPGPTQGTLRAEALSVWCRLVAAQSSAVCLCCLRWFLPPTVGHPNHFPFSWFGTQWLLCPLAAEWSTAWLETDHQSSNPASVTDELCGL